MGKSVKDLFEIELLDTLAKPTKVIKRGTARARYPKAALSKFSKGLGVNLSEERPDKKSRYVFLWGRKKG